MWHLPTAPAVSTREIHVLIERRVGRPLNVVVLPEARPFGPFDERFMGEYAEIVPPAHGAPDHGLLRVRAGLRRGPAPLTGTIDAALARYGRGLANR